MVTTRGPAIRLVQRSSGALPEAVELQGDAGIFPFALDQSNQNEQQ
jgi:hypothetical protein